MSSISVADAKNQFSDLLRRAEYAGERVVVHRHGKPVAAIVSTRDLERLQALEDTQDVEDAAAALKEAARGGTLPLAAVLRRHGLSHLLDKPAKAAGGERPPRRTNRKPASKRAGVPSAKKRPRG